MPIYNPKDEYKPIRVATARHGSGRPKKGWYIEMSVDQDWYRETKEEAVETAKELAVKRGYPAVEIYKEDGTLQRTWRP